MFEKEYKYQDIKNLKIVVRYNNKFDIEGICILNPKIFKYDKEGICINNPKIFKSYYIHSIFNCLAIKVNSFPKSFSSSFFISSNNTTRPLSNEYSVYIPPNIITSINVIKSDYESLLLLFWLKKNKNTIPDEIFNYIQEYIKGSKSLIPVIF